MTLEKSLLEGTLDRRSLLKGSLTLSATAMISAIGVKPVWAAPTDGRYTVNIVNKHTHERFEGLYRVGNEYLPEAFENINTTLRDHRTDEIFPIDPRVIDIAVALHKMTGTRRPFEIISGYRSPKTNAMLRSNSSAVAKKSLHMSGQALDIQVADVPISRLRDVAIKLKAGGVGYYPKSNFVHVDSGRFRTW
ncbi:MAG: twin-arginine translocation pathway signal sequence domain-containing protein [Micavibrio sp.]|nr:twin-arginine translocation pathway signal sequence domain-containing protein [Micavibrio sp.]